MAKRVIQGYFQGGARLAPPTVAPVAFPARSPVAVPTPGGGALQRVAMAGLQPNGRPPLVHGNGASAVQRRTAPGRPSLVHRGQATPAAGPAQPLQGFGGDGSFAVDPAQVGLVRSGGNPLPGALLAKMEAAFGADFSGVRVHVGPQASRIGALAFTTGNDLYFAPGQYQPDSMKGQQLIGHELAHVVQQRQGRVRAPGSGVAVVQDRALEAEADRLGMKAAAHRMPLQPKTGGAGPLQRRAATTASVAGPGRTRIAAGHRGSLIAHDSKGASVLVTDLQVGAVHRDRGIGRDLLAGAARAGLRSGKSSVSLSAQDDGSGRLTRWYKDLGFRQVGVNDRGYPEMIAPIGRLMGGAAQAKQAPGARVGVGRVVQRSFQVNNITFKNPPSFSFTLASAQEAIKPLPRGEVKTQTGGTAKSGVEIGDIASYVIVQFLEKVGDQLTGDHQPSGAAIKEHIRLLLHASLNHVLTRSMAKNAYAKAITIVMTDAWHKSTSRTYGGRNTKQQIATDAANLMQASIEDWKRTVGELQKTFDDQDIVDLWNAFNVARADFFSSGEIQWSFVQ